MRQSWLQSVYVLGWTCVFRIFAMRLAGQRLRVAEPYLVDFSRGKKNRLQRTNADCEFILITCCVKIVDFFCLFLPVSVRLVDGPRLREGRLQVYRNSSWGTVCDNGFTDAAAKVVCYTLGYG